MSNSNKNFDRLIVSGCSFSDYTLFFSGEGKEDKTYSEYLAEKLQLEHVPGFTSGCGSNYRIWRKLLTGIREGSINSNDLLVIQYTEPTRKEFWSRHIEPTHRVSKEDPMREPYGDGQIIKFKVNPIIYQPIEENTLFRLLEENFVDPAYDLELFKNHHFAFVNVLNRHKINAIFLKTIYLDLIETHKSPYCKLLNIKEGIDNQPLFPYKEYCLSDSDCFHLSDKGHRKVADLLYEFITSQFEF